MDNKEKVSQINNTVFGMPVIVSLAVPEGHALMAPDHLLKKVAAGETLSVEEAKQCCWMKTEE